MAHQKALIAYANVFNLQGPNATADWAHLTKYDHILINEAPYSSATTGIPEHTPDAANNLTSAQIAHIKANAIKYFDVWGKDAYATKVWQPGPGHADAGTEPDITLNTSVHCYRMTNRHIDRFYGWVEAAVLDGTYPCKGAFLDDYEFDKNSWTGTDQLKVWGAHNGMSGYNTSDWNSTRMTALLTRLNRLAANRGKYMLYNGHSDISGPGYPRMWEGYGKLFSRATLQSGANAGDWIVVFARDLTANDTLGWYEVQEGDDETSYGYAAGTSYGPSGILGDALEDAENMGLVVAVALNNQGSYGSYTYNGVAFGSVFALIDDPDGWGA